jgi:DNA polymerase III subunit gamma/tau
MLAKRSEGSFRDSLKLLDQIASMGEKITIKSIEEALRSGNFEILTTLLEHISKNDSTSALSLVSSEVESGINIKEFIISITDLMRSMLLLKHGASSQVKEYWDEEKFSKLQDLVSKFSSEKIIRTLDLLQKAYEKLKFASIPQLPLEIAIVESSLNEQSNVESVVIPISEAYIEPGKDAVDEKEDLRPSRVEIKEEQKPANTSKAGSEPEVSGPVQDDVLAVSSSDASEKVLLLDKWTYILEAIRPYNYSLEALLKQVKLVSSENGSVVLEVPYSFHQRILEAPKSRNLLESVLTDILGKPAKVKCKLGIRPVRIEELANVELAEDDEVIRVAAEIFSSEPAN